MSKYQFIKKSDFNTLVSKSRIALQESHDRLQPIVDHLNKNLMHNFNEEINDSYQRVADVISQLQEQLSKGNRYEY